MMHPACHSEGAPDRARAGVCMRQRRSRGGGVCVCMCVRGVRVGRLALVDRRHGGEGRVSVWGERVMWRASVCVCVHMRPDRRGGHARAGAAGKRVVRGARVCMSSVCMGRVLHG